MNSIIVTGGCGFIGSAFILYLMQKSDLNVVNIDCLTYAGNPENLRALDGSDRYTHVIDDIADAAAVVALLKKVNPVALVNFAAETHVDRSISAPLAFARTNVLGTVGLLEATREWWNACDEHARSQFRFLHISTDEVYGSLAPFDAPFRESNSYSPNSPYAASKAASDHFVRAYGATFGLPVMITNCSNNFGPRQFPEKLVPFMITRAIAGESLLIYGNGENVRDWLYVDDHCSAIWAVLRHGRLGETYNVGGGVELTNNELVRKICGVLDELRPRRETGSYAAQIAYVSDRPGHDKRYAIDSRKLQSELGWHPQEKFDARLRQTVHWYLEHGEWLTRVVSGSYREWVARQYRKA